MRWEGLKKTFNAPCCCHGSKIRVLRKKSSGRKMVKCKMTRYSEEDWKRRGRGTKKRAPFKTSQTFLKKKKKSKDWKSAARVTKLLSSNFRSSRNRSSISSRCVRTIIPSPSNLLLLILLYSTLKSIYCYFSETLFSNNYAIIVQSSNLSNLIPRDWSFRFPRRSNPF